MEHPVPVARLGPGERLAVGALTLEGVATTGPDTTPNLVTRIHFAGTRVLSTSRADTEGLALLSGQPDVRSEVLIVPRPRVEVPAALLRAVSPRLLVTHSDGSDCAPCLRALATARAVGAHGIVVEPNARTEIRIDARETTLHVLPDVDAEEEAFDLPRR